MGHVLLNVICRKHLVPRCRGLFWSLMDERSNVSPATINFIMTMCSNLFILKDLMRLATDVFTDTGILRKDIYSPVQHSDRTLAWSREDAERLKDQPTLYIEELVIKRHWQNKGIGTWTILNLYNTDYIRTFDADYLTAWPTVLQNLEPPRNIFSNVSAADEKAFVVKRERIIAFFRKVSEYEHNLF